MDTHIKASLYLQAVNNAIGSPDPLAVPADFAPAVVKQICIHPVLKHLLPLLCKDDLPALLGHPLMFQLLEALQCRIILAKFAKLLVTELLLENESFFAPFADTSLMASY